MKKNLYFFGQLRLNLFNLLLMRGINPELPPRRFISLACVSSETHNLQRAFRPGGIVPYIGYIGLCRAKGFVFF